MKYAVFGISFWLICGVTSAGFTNAYFARKYDLCKGREELSTALLFGLIGGPAALLVSVGIGGFGEYGWSLHVLNNKYCLPKEFKY